MADEFNVLDIVTAAVCGCDTGLNIYQVNSPDNEDKEHIVINYLPFNELEYVGQISINVNIFTKGFKNGSPSIDYQAAIKRKIISALRKMAHPAGMYWNSRVLWSERVFGLKEDFDCINIRLEVITEK